MLSEKMLLLLGCALNFLFSLCGAEVSRHKFGLPRRAEQSSSAVSFSAAVTLSISEPCDLSPHNPSAVNPAATALVKINQNLPNSLLQKVAPEMPP